MAVLVAGNLDDFRRHRLRAVSVFEQATQVEPVERQDHVRFGQHFQCFRPEAVRRRCCVQAMVGREGGGELHVGQHAHVELLGEGDALVPGIQAAQAAAREHHRVFRARQQLRRGRDQLG
ncbi:hypothetical protein D3C83_22890 [compost metagenome]